MVHMSAWNSKNLNPNMVMADLEVQYKYAQRYDEAIGAHQP